MALGFEAGKVFVRIAPDTSDFNKKLMDDLRRAKARAEKLMRIKVTPYIDRVALKHVRDQLNSLEGNAKIHTDVDNADANSALRDLRDRIQDALGDGGTLGLDTSDAENRLHRWRRIVEHTTRDMDRDARRHSPIHDLHDTQRRVVSEKTTFNRDRSNLPKNQEERAAEIARNRRDVAEALRNENAALFDNDRAVAAADKQTRKFQRTSNIMKSTFDSLPASLARANQQLRTQQRLMEIQEKIYQRVRRVGGEPQSQMTDALKNRMKNRALFNQSPDQEFSDTVRRRTLFKGDGNAAMREAYTPKLPKDADLQSFLAKVKRAGTEYTGLLNRIAQGEFARKPEWFERFPESNFERVVGQLADKWREFGAASEEATDRATRGVERGEDKLQKYLMRVESAIAKITSGQFNDPDDEDVTQEFFNRRDTHRRRAGQKKGIPGDVNLPMPSYESDMAHSAFPLHEKVMEMAAEEAEKRRGMTKEIYKQNDALLKRIKAAGTLNSHFAELNRLSGINDRLAAMYNRRLDELGEKLPKLNRMFQAAKKTGADFDRDRQQNLPQSRVVINRNRYDRPHRTEPHRPNEALFRSGDPNIAIREAMTPKRMKLPGFDKDYIRQFNNIKRAIKGYEAEQNRFLNRTKRKFKETNKSIRDGARKTARESGKFLSSIQYKNLASIGAYDPNAKMFDRSQQNRASELRVKLRDDTSRGLQNMRRRFESATLGIVRSTEQQLGRGLNAAFKGTYMKHAISDGFRKALDGSAMKEFKDFTNRVKATKVKFKTDLDEEGIHTAMKNLRQTLKTEGAKAGKKAIKVGFELHKDGFRILKNLMHDLPRDIMMRVNLDSKEAQRRINNLKENFEVTAQADADTLRAKLKLMRLARPRFVAIIPYLNKAATAKVAATLAALAGARATKQLMKNFSDFAKDMDKNLLSFANIGMAITNLISLISAGTSQIFTLGASILSIIPAAAAIPGILGGIAVGGFVLVKALKQWNDRLKDVNDRLEQVNKKAADNFWTRAEKPIRNMIDSLFPQWERGITSVGDKLGGLFANAAQSAEKHFGNGMMERLFGHLEKAIDQLAQAMDPFIEGFIRLSDIGGAFLPKFAEWLTDIANQFNEWTKTADISGAIERGVQAMKDLWRVTTETWGILVAITKAAQDAGGVGLGGFANGLALIRGGLESVEGQYTMSTLFQGGNEAIGNLKGSFDQLGQTLYTLAENIKQAMWNASEALNAFTTLLGNAFRSTDFMNGFDAAFEGVKNGMQGLAEYGEPLGTILGTLGRVFGAMAENFLPLFGKALEILAPMAEGLGNAVLTLIPVLAGAFKEILEWIGEHVTPIVLAITDWIQQNPQLAATIGAVAVGFGLLLQALGPVFGFLGGAVGIISGIIGAIGPFISLVTSIGAALAPAGVVVESFGAALGVIGGVLGSLAAPVAIAVAAIGALVGFFVYAWNTSEEFRNKVFELWNALTEAAQPVIDFITETVIPGFQRLWDSLVQGVQPILDAVIPIINDLITVIVKIIEYCSPVVDFLMTVLAPVFNALVDIVGGVFKAVGEIIGKAFEFIGSILHLFVDLFSGNWDKLGDDIMNIWNKLWDFVVTLIGNVVGTILGILGRLGKMLLDIVVGIWDKVGDGFIKGIDFVVNAVRNMWNWVMDLFKKGPSGVINDVKNFISDLIRNFNIKDMATRGWNMIVDFGNGLWRGFKNVVKGTVNNIIKSIKGFFPNSPAKWGPFSGRGYVTYSAKAIATDFSNSLRDGRDQMTAAAAYALSGAQAQFDSAAQFEATAKAQVQESLQVELESSSDKIYQGVRDALSAGVQMQLDPNTDKAIMRYNAAGERRARRIYA